jgi:hypothetical protein
MSRAMRIRFHSQCCFCHQSRRFSGTRGRDCAVTHPSPTPNVLSSTPRCTREVRGNFASNFYLSHILESLWNDRTRLCRPPPLPPSRSRPTSPDVPANSSRCGRDAKRAILLLMCTLSIGRQSRKVSGMTGPDCAAPRLLPPSRSRPTLPRWPRPP